MNYSLSSENVLRDGWHAFFTDGRGCLLSYAGPGKAVKIPKGVRYIGEEAFAFCDQVTEVVLPEGVESIGQRAFRKSGIRTVSLPETLTRIGDLAFAGTPLEHVEIPDRVKDLGKQAFRGAANLKTAKLPEGITSLEPEVFCGCASLKEIVVPEKVKYIHGGVFKDCTGLERVTLPENLAVVWTKAFCGCSSLREIFLGDSVEALGSAAFRGCTALEKVRIPKGVEMTCGSAFGNNCSAALTGPGQEAGLMISRDPEVYYHPVLKKVTVSEGIEEMPTYVLGRADSIEVMDLPESLKYYSWKTFTQHGQLRQIVTDRDALAAEIALLLDLESVDREGRKFTFSVPEKSGEWITEPDDEHDGLRLTGCRGEIGRTGEATYTTVVIPDRINGKPVTCIGAGAFDGCDFADAFYIPDSVRQIESRAFGHNRFCTKGRELFVRLPEYADIAKDAFEGTKYFTKEKFPEPPQPETPEEEAPKTPGPTVGRDCAADAADDPAVGTGTDGYPKLMPNIWQYFDRMNREDRIRELTHFFKVEGKIDGAGWAMVRIDLDGETAWFRISYIGNSPADFRTFVNEIGDGEDCSFGWSSEPGFYRWRIQRRGGIFYVNVPVIGESFFIPRAAFLDAVSGMTDEW